MYLLDHLPEFMNRYPEIRLEVEFNDRMIDVVAEGYDVVVRVGSSKDSNLVARQFTVSKSVVVASPGYLQERGRPVSVSDLEQHDCLAYSLLANPKVWEFIKDGQRTTVNFEPRLMGNNAEIEVAMMVKGIGIGRVPLFCCQQELDRGELEIILEDYDQPELGIYAIYPHRQYLTAKVRSFVDFLVEKFDG